MEIPYYFLILWKCFLLIKILKFKSSFRAPMIEGGGDYLLFKLKLIFYLNLKSIDNGQKYRVIYNV